MVVTPQGYVPRDVAYLNPGTLEAEIRKHIPQEHLWW